MLRALQSLGASAVLAIAFGVVADVCPPAERGSMLGSTQSTANLAVCLGPVIGGWVALGSGGSTWVFWALVIFGGTVLFIVGVALPETARNVVGNGSLEATGWYKTWWSTMRESTGVKTPKAAASKQGHMPEEAGMKEVEAASGREFRHLKMMNPLNCIRIIFWKDTAVVLWMAASPYAVWYYVQTSIPAIYKDYRFNDFEIGLSYLTGGVGAVVGGYANGKLMDRNYREIAKAIRHSINRLSGDNLKHFLIERARARGSWYLLGTYICTLGGYGWSVHAHVHESVPLILQFVLAALCTNRPSMRCLSIFSPSSPSTAAASSNITRCILSALAFALLQSLVNAMGRGWYFTFLTFVSRGGGIAANWAINAHGMRWRSQRVSRADEKLKVRINENSSAQECSAAPVALTEKVERDGSRP